MIDNHNTFQASGAATPRKRSREEAMLEVVGQNDDTLITVHFTDYKSEIGFDGWWSSNCAVKNTIGEIIASDVHLCFVDALGLLALAAGTHNSGGLGIETMAYSYKAQQIGYATLEATLLYQSIDKQLPAMFGKLTSTTGERILPLFLTFLSWDNQDGETSFVNIQKRELQNC